MRLRTLALLLPLAVLRCGGAPLPSRATGPAPSSSTGFPVPAATARVPVFQARVTDQARHLMLVRWRPDGGTVAIAAGDAVQIREASTGRLRAEAHPGFVACVEWSPAGDVLAVLTTDGHLHPWTMHTGVLDELVGPTQLRLEPQTDPGLHGNLVWSPDGRRLVAAGQRGFYVWDLPSRIARPTRDVGTSGGFLHRDIAWTPDGRAFATTMSDGSGAIVDAATGEVRKELHAADPGHAVRVVAFAPDGARLAYWAEQEPLRVLDVRSGQAKEAPEAVGTGGTCLAWEPSGASLLAGCGLQDGIVVWNQATGDVQRASGSEGGREAWWSTFGDRFVERMDDGNTKVFDARSARLVTAMVTRGWVDPALGRTLDFPDQGAGGIFDLANKQLQVPFPKDVFDTSPGIDVAGTRLLWRRRDHVVSIDLARGQVTHVAADPRDPRRLSPDGRVVARFHGGRTSDTLLLEDAATSTPLLPPIAVQDGDILGNTIWSAKGRYVALRVGRKPLFFQVWDARTGAAVSRFPVADSNDRFAFTPDEAAVVVASRNELHVLDLTSGTQRYDVKDTGNVWTVGSWSSDGRWMTLIRIGDGTAPTAMLFEAKTGASAGLLPGPPLSSWSPDGARIVVGRTRRDTCVWDAGSRACVAELAPSGSEPAGPGMGDLRWSPGGSLLWRSAGKLEVYDARTGALRTTLAGPGGSFGPFWIDDDHLVSDGHDLTALRVSDGATLRIAAAEDDSSLLATSPDGAFDGGPSALHRLLFRGDDVLASPLRPVDTTSPGRTPGLLQRFMAPGRYTR